MTRVGKESVKIPDTFLRIREMLGQETAAILLRKKAVETPLAFHLGAYIEQVDHQQIARFSAVNTDRAGEKVDDRQVDIADVVSGVVVLDETAGPVVRFQNEVVAGFDPERHWNIRMPAAVNLLVVECGLFQVDLDERIGHVTLLL